MSLSQDHSYQQILISLKDKIRLARQRAIVSVNTQLLAIYWEIGQAILRQQQEAGWGAKIIDTLSADLRAEFPDLKGLSVRNLKYMRAFAEAYPTLGSIVQTPVAQLQKADSKEDEFVQSLIAQLSWTHHIRLLDGVKDPTQRLFYLQKAVENGWSANVLVHQIESRLHERQGAALTNFEQTLLPAQSDLAREMLKSPYIFDFVSMQDAMQERDLERALLEHLKKFMLELGRGFAYVGNQFPLAVGNQDFFPDLLFYNYHLHCFVVFDLKMGAFQPEFAGKMHFYVNAIDEQVKSDKDGLTIGVLLCKSADATVVKFSLSGIDSPLGVTEYQLAAALPEYKTEFPSIEELEQELDKEYDSLKSPAQKRIDALKDRIASLNNEEIKTFATPELIEKAYYQNVVPLFNMLLSRLSELADTFLHVQCSWQGKNGNLESLELPPEEWVRENDWLATGDHHFWYYYAGLKKSSTESFDITLSFAWTVDRAWYGFKLDNQNHLDALGKKLYHERLSTVEQMELCDAVMNHVADRIEYFLSRLDEKS